jgi:aspartate 1-decarboxylase
MVIVGVDAALRRSDLGGVMKRNMLKSKIHRATVTMADLDYVGSIEIDVDLMEAADIVTNEQVHVWNITTGDRLTTYAIPGKRGSGTICINGAAAHLANKGDLVIVASFSEMEAEEAQTWQPRLVFVDAKNRIIPDEELAVAAH